MPTLDHRLRRTRGLLSSLLVATVPVAGCHFDLSCGTAEERSSDSRELTMIAQPAADGWMLMFTGLEAEPESMRVRLGDDEFRTLRRPLLQLPADAAATDVVAYYTMRGVEHGPLHFRFDPRTALVEHSKDALDVMHRSWVAWREHAGKTRVLFTALNMLSCALERVEYGFAGTPDTQWTLPPCRGPLTPATPSYPISIEAPTGATTIAVRLTFVDGEQTAVEHFPNDAQGR